MSACGAWVARSACALSLVMLAVLVDASTARPCSPSPFFVAGRRVLPVDGASDVARDASAWVHITIAGDYDEPDRNPPLRFEDLAEIAVREAGSDAPLEGEITSVIGGDFVFVRFTPATMLAADTAYEVLDRAHVGLDTLGPLAVLATFTTGDGFDTTAPEPPHVTASGRCDACTSCEGCVRLVDEIRLVWAPAPPDAWVEITHESGLVIWPAGDTATTRVGESAHSDFGAGIDGVFDVRFVDASGNRSEATRVDIRGQDCGALDATTEPHFGDVGGGGASDADDDGASEGAIAEAEARAPASGCGAGAHGEGGALVGLGVLVVVLALVALTRRRRPTT